ncbi:hypothetical protein DYH09_02455 [bacterium CPR1]|nr:hypothetical protein [bacterium CPR1]
MDALNQIDARADWDVGFDRKKLSQMEGFYSIKFHSGPGRPDEDESVNNLTGATPVNGYRQGHQIPPGCVELVIIAEVGGATRTIRTMVGGTPASSTMAGMMAGGNILLRGNVVVEGFSTLTTGAQAVQANLQSNRPDSAAGVIRWVSANPGDRASVSGAVRTVSADAAAIDFGPDATAYQAGSFEVGATAVALGRVDIVGEIGNHTGDPAPAINPIGTNNLPAGACYQGGDLVINGDLSLDDTNLYVDGNLTVNGSVTGTGSIYVKGDTSFQGDAAIYTNNVKGVALFSEGNVRLTGLDGTAYMDAVTTSNPQAAIWWQDAQDTMQALNGRIQTSLANPNAKIMQVGPQYIDEMRQVLGTDANANHATWDGRTRDATGKLQAYLNTQPASSSRDFMLERLDYMQRVFADDNNPYNPVGVKGRDVLKEWDQGGDSYYGLIDAATDAVYGSPQHVEQMLNLIMRIDYEKMGSSYFQGTIYTNGWFHASNEITVVGSLTSGGDRSGQPTTIGSEEIRCGDIVLDNNCRLTLTQDYAPPGQSQGSSGLSLKSWLEP